MQIDPHRWPVLSRLMDQMLDLPPGERSDWVRGLTGSEAEMVPQLMTLLQSGSAGAGTDWMDTLPKLGEGVLLTMMESGAGYEDVGEEIGPYRLVRLIARGGMGSVWYAERSDRLVRRGVALKLPLGSSRQLAARFSREREIVASLVHPNIARLYDAGIAESGQAYLALEYVEGQTLDQYCDVNRLGVRARVALFGQVLSAVQYAHSRLVIHRDIKPSNILVNNDGEVRLLDFGVAKLLDPETTEPSELTQLADPGMTLAYASPEQVAGKPVTTATDVYSLGVVLFELLAGVRPYRTRRDTRGALEEAILQADIPLASSMAGGTEETQEVLDARGTTLSRLRRELQGDVDSILIKALSRAPQDRYETVASFADDLTRYLDGRVVRAHRRSRWYQLQKFVGRNRIGVGAALATVLALTATTGVALWQASEAERHARMAAIERDRAVAAESNRAVVNEFMSDLLIDAGRIGKPITIPALITRADELSAHQFADAPEVRAAVLQSVGTLELDLEMPEKALATFTQAEAMAANSKDSELRVRLACDKALLDGTLGRVDEAQKTLDALAADPQTPIDAASDCMGKRSELAYWVGNGLVAERTARQALAMWELTPSHRPRRHLELLEDLANAAYLNGDPKSGDAGLAYIMVELRRMGRENSEFADNVRSDGIVAAITTGDLPHAMALIDESDAILAHDAPGTPPTLIKVYQRGAVNLSMGRFAEAARIFEQIVRMKDASDRPTVRLAMLKLAVSYSHLGRRQEAELLYRRAVDEASRDPAAQDSGNREEVPRRIARALLDMDRRAFPAARIDLDAAIALGGELSTQAILHYLRASAELQSGDTAAALQDARNALEAGRKVRGTKPYSVLVGRAQLALGQALEQQGDSKGAREACIDAVNQLENTVDARHPDLILARAMLGGEGGARQGESTRSHAH